MKKFKNLIIVLAFLSIATFLNGCYTQISTVRDDDSDRYYSTSDPLYNNYIGTDSTRPNTIINNYYMDYPRYRYSFNYYYPYRFYSYDPWWDFDYVFSFNWAFGWNTWYYPYYPYPYYYSPYYYHPLVFHYPYDWYYRDRDYYRWGNDTRYFGSTRGSSSRSTGVTRTSGNYPGVNINRTNTNTEVDRGTRSGTNIRTDESSRGTRTGTGNVDRSGVRTDNNRNTDNTRSSGNTRGNRYENIYNHNTNPQPIIRDNPRNLTPIQIQQNPSSRIGRSSGSGYNYDHSSSGSRSSSSSGNSGRSSGNSGGSSSSGGGNRSSGATRGNR